MTVCSANKRKERSLFSTPSDNTKQCEVLSWIFQCRIVSKGRPVVCSSGKALFKVFVSLLHLPIFSFSRPSKSYFTAACADPPKCPCWHPRWILGNSLVTSTCTSANAYFMCFFHKCRVIQSHWQTIAPTALLTSQNTLKLPIKYAWACISSVIPFRIVEMVIRMRTN